MLGQPVVQLDSGAVRHSEIGHHDLIAMQARTSQLSQCISAIFGFLRVPPAPAKIASHRRADGGLIVHDERTPPESGVGDVREMRISLGHCCPMKPRRGDRPGEPRV